MATLDQAVGAQRHPVVLTLGFRPFFLVAGCAAVALVGLWLLEYAGTVALDTYYPAPAIWHGHEMLFGYTAAVIAGFLLTAVRNWTSLDTLRGLPLGALLALWIAGRLGAVLPDAPRWLVAALDVAFLPALAASLAVPLLRRRQWRNVPFVPVLLVLAAGNALVHCEALGLRPGSSTTGLYLGAQVIVLLIAIIGGRVIPFFTERALPGARPRVWRPVEWVAIGTLVALLAATAFGLPAEVRLAVAAVAAVAHGVRLWGWTDRRIRSVPLLWILFAGYGWVVIGLALEAFSAAGVVRPQLALHAFTAGAIGALTLGMMSRVALGHTGRPLRVPTALSGAFVLVNVAALLRVFAAGWLPDPWYVPLVVAAGVAWMAAFTVFVAIYTPILTAPRADGLPG